MALFGNNEDKQLKQKEKQAKKEAAKREQMDALKQSEEAEIDKFDGNYIAIDFDSQDWSNSNSMIISKVYKKVAEYANRHNLMIVNISRIEDGPLKTVTVSVIFEK